MDKRDTEYQVIVSGAGPVGLALACELRLHDVSTLVVERLPPGSGEPRVLTLHSRTLETLDRRGLVAELAAAEQRLPGLAEFRQRMANTSARGHFAGLFGLGRGTVRTEQPRELAATREDIKEILGRRAAAAGASVRYRTELVGLDQDDAGMAVTLAGPGGVSTVRADYVVGCDGGRSAVRRLAGIGFPGSDPALVSWTGLAAVVDEDRIRLGWQRTGRGWLMRMADGRISTLEWDIPIDLSAPATAAGFADAIERVTGRRPTLTDVRFVTRFTDSTRLARRYRAGRVFLAGDAAHVHFPAGGQGVNLGLQDAVNLGWKLAGACRGWASQSLVDSYEAERRPVADRALRNTQAQVALMRPGTQVDALRELFADLMAVPEVNDRLTGQICGTDIHYPSADDSRIGHFVPDRPLKTENGPARLAELLRDGRPVLLDHTAGAFADHVAEHQAAKHAVNTVAPWRDRVIPAAADPGEDEPPLLLVRPDGYLAWAGADPTTELRTALTTWCGPAVRTPATGL